MAPHIYRKSIVITLFLLLTSFTQAQLFTVKGKVIDEYTQEPLAFVSILANNENHGITTDIDGKFLVSRNNKIIKIRTSYLGYESQSLDVKSNEILIKLKKATYELKQVEVFPGENPAYRIVQRAIENRDINNPEKHGSFTYTAYNKMTFTADTLHPLREKKTDSTNKLAKQFVKKNDIMLMESVSNRKFLFPDRNNETVIASRVSGLKDPSFTFLATQFQSFSFYKDQFKISGKNYVNPISKSGFEKYFFLIEDTLYEANDTIFIVSFTPHKYKYFDALKGLLYINTNSYALENVIAEPYSGDNSIDIKIQQKSEFVGGKQWFPVQINADMTFNNIALGNYKIVGIGRTYIKDIVINPALKNSEFSEASFNLSKDASKGNTSLLNMYRPDSLSDREKDDYRVIDSLSRKENLDLKIKGMETLLKGKIPWGYIDIEPDKFIRINQYEGVRLWTKFNTNIKFSKVLTIGAFGGYGFKDQQAKYGGSVSVKLFNPLDIAFNIDYSLDALETGSTQLYYEPRLNYLEVFRKVLISNMYLVEKETVSLDIAPQKHLKLNVFFNRKKITITSDYKFGVSVNDISIFNDDIIFAEGGISFRYAYREKFLDIFNNKISQGSAYPIIFGQVAYGFSNLLGSNYTFSRVDIKINQSLNLNAFGKTTLQFVGGFINGDLPLVGFYNAKASYKQFLVASANSFVTMRMNEFFSNRYAAFFITHNFGAVFYRTSISTPELCIAHNMTVGSLNNLKKHFNVSINTLEKGYFESGILLNKILRSDLGGFGFGVYYRYGHYGFKNHIDNLAYKFTLSLILK